MEILQLVKKGDLINILEKFHVYNITLPENQTLLKNIIQNQKTETIILNMTY
jgi:hypothetical protein